MNQNKEYEDMPVKEKKKKQELLDHREDVIYKESIRILGSYQEELRLKGALK